MRFELRRLAQCLRCRPAVDAGIIAMLAMIAEGAHFAVRQGRAVVCADSLQYLDNALALAEPSVGADFAFRKPGYSLLMAAVLTVGPAWAVILVNHLLAALTAPMAYALGRRLSGLRGAGWLAGLATIARLQASVWSDRVMSEALYAFLATVFLLCLATAAARRQAMRWVAAAGVALAAAWLTRSAAMALLIGAAAWGTWLLFRERRRWPAAAGCLLIPLGAAWLAESGMNLAGAGRFRPGTGTLGPMLVMRACFLQGAPLAPGPARMECLELLPERAPQDAYRVNKLDAWVARARARRDGGLDEWQADALFRQAGWDTLCAALPAYVRTTAELFGLQLLRGDPDRLSSAFVREDERPVILTTSHLDSAHAPIRWYAEWALPHRDPRWTAAVIRRLDEFETRRAPFTLYEPFSTMRYAAMLPAMQRLLAVIGAAGGIGPLMALLGCLWIGSDRRTCLLIAAVYMADAAIAAATMTSLDSVPRLQAVWLPVDSALSAACLGWVVAALFRGATRLRDVRRSAASGQAFAARERGGDDQEHQAGGLGHGQPAGAVNPS